MKRRKKWSKFTSNIKKIFCLQTRGRCRARAARIIKMYAITADTGDLFSSVVLSIRIFARASERDGRLTAIRCIWAIVFATSAHSMRTRCHPLDHRQDFTIITATSGVVVVVINRLLPGNNLNYFLILLAVAAVWLDICCLRLASEQRKKRVANK